jgi:hypothetical protein
MQKCEFFLIHADKSKTK